MNNQNIFQIRAAQRDNDKYSNVIDSFKNPSQSVEIEGENENENLSSKNIFEQRAELNKKREEKKFSALETLQDIGEQVSTKGIAGALGSYGNILNAVGLNSKEEVLPGQRQVNNIQSQILDKINKGEVPSYGELMLLSDDSEYPTYHRLPTSKDIQGHLKGLTGIGEGKTAAGRIAGHGAEAIGEALPMGGGGAKVLASLGAGNAVGQTVRELGGPEMVASGIEIGSSLAPSVISKKLSPTSKAAKDTVNAGRKIGLTENQITPLIQGETKSAVLGKVARKGTKTKELFSSIKESLGNSYSNIKSSVSNLGNVNASNRQILLDKFTNIRNDLAKTIKASPDKEAAINFIDDAIAKISKNGASPEELINFWQDINKSVKWNSIQGGKKSLTRLKEPISEVLHNVAPNAAKDFEMTNELYTKYSQISKKLKPDLVDSFVNKGEIISAAPAALSLAYGNPMPLMSLGGEVATRLLAREMLINPYFQNVATKLVTNFNQGSVKGIKDTVNQVKEYMTRKHPNQDWSFLTDPESLNQ